MQRIILAHEKGKEAEFYRPLEDKVVNCYLCAHRCRIGLGKRGICGVRENRNGLLYTLVYGKAISNHIDPIEKKPLFHFLPGTLSYSLATVGCNFRCDFCQNWEISQAAEIAEELIPGVALSPEKIVREALSSKCRSISYTYTEPTIFFEYAYDTKEKKGTDTFFLNALPVLLPYPIPACLPAGHCCGGGQPLWLTGE